MGFREAGGEESKEFGMENRRYLVQEHSHQSIGIAFANGKGNDRSFRKSLCRPIGAKQPAQNTASVAFCNKQNKWQIDEILRIEFHKVLSRNGLNQKHQESHFFGTMNAVYNSCSETSVGPHLFPDQN